MKNIADNLQTLQKQEAEFARTHKSDTDAELYEYLKKLKSQHGKRLNPTTTIGYTYLVKRLGAWNEVMRKISTDLKNGNERTESN